MQSGLPERKWQEETAMLNVWVNFNKEISVNGDVISRSRLCNHPVFILINERCLFYPIGETELCPTDTNSKKYPARNAINLAKKVRSNEDNQQSTQKTQLVQLQSQLFSISSVRWNCEIRRVLLDVVASG